MKINRALEQHIAVFGESGSGKTVMISSFYGAMQEPHFLQKSLFHVLAEDASQGTRLHQNYLGMKNSARLPMTTRFTATSYSFAVKLKEGSLKAMKAKPFDALRLVWHDYPGEWFEEQVSGPEEAQRRVDTFKTLMGSDVALLLVDGQRMLDNTGEEERYLKSLLTNFRNSLLSLKDDLLEDGKPLVEFPRIWVMALSKADLFPDWNVFTFRDLLIEKAGDEVEELRKVIGGLVEAGDALSVGEDFVLLSSAEFAPNKVEVTHRIGLDLILPIAAMLPFERHVRWAQAKQMPNKVAERLLPHAESLAVAFIDDIIRRSGPVNLLLNLIGRDRLVDAVHETGEQLRKRNKEALDKQDTLTATLTGFRMDLETGEQEQILLRSLT